MRVMSAKLKDWRCPSLNWITTVPDEAGGGVAAKQSGNGKREQGSYAQESTHGISFTS